MFVVVYEWQVRPELEEQFQDAWQRVTLAAIRNCGALGSRLHRTDEGKWVAYAQWPTREQWEKFVVESPPDPAALQAEKTCIIGDNIFRPVLKMAVTDDLLFRFEPE